MFDGPLAAALDPGERRARLRLARSARIGPMTFHEALAHFGSARAACARLDTTTEAAIATLRSNGLDSPVLEGLARFAVDRHR